MRKTAVAHALLGYARRGLELSGGEVWIDDENLLALSQSELRKIRGRTIAYASKDPSSALNPGLRIGHQMRLALKHHAAPSVEALSEGLRKVQLDDPDRILGLYPHALSGGSSNA